MLDRQSVVSIGRVSAVCRPTRRPICVLTAGYGCNLVDAWPIPYRHLTDSLKKICSEIKLTSNRDM